MVPIGGVGHHGSTELDELEEADGDGEGAEGRGDRRELGLSLRNVGHDDEDGEKPRLGDTRENLEVARLQQDHGEEGVNHLLAGLRVQGAEVFLDGLVAQEQEAREGEADPWDEVWDELVQVVVGRAVVEAEDREVAPGLALCEGLVVPERVVVHAVAEDEELQGQDQEDEA